MSLDPELSKYLKRIEDRLSQLFKNQKAKSSGGGSGGSGDASAENQLLQLSEEQYINQQLTQINLDIQAGNSLASALNQKIPDLGQSTMTNSLPVTIANNQTTLPVLNSENPVITTGTITGSGNSIQRALSGAAGAYFQLGGTYVGIGIFFEVSYDNAATWYPTYAYPTGDSEAGIFLLNPIGGFTIYAPGATNVRIRSNGYTSGTMNVSITAINRPYKATIPKNRFFIGNASLSTLGNSLIVNATSASSVTGVDVQNYNSFAAQIIGSAGISAGAIIFEGSNDNVTFVPLQVHDDALTTGVPIVSAINIAASAIRFFSGKTAYRYVRCRISTAFVGGTVQGIFRFSDTDYIPRTQPVSSQSSANFPVLASIANAQTIATVTTVNTVTASQSAIPGSIVDIASAAITATGTGATITPTFGATYKVSIPVTAVSGTTPTMDVSIEESSDGGANWYKVYDFPRITAIGFYHSPVIPLTGNRIRYVQTLAGTTPSFTRSIVRLQSSWTSADRTRQIIDRTVVLTTLSSVTPALYVAGTTGLQLVINIGAVTTTPPALQIQGSDDGVNWYNLGTPLAAVASSTVQLTLAGLQVTFVRAIVTTAGVGVTAGYVLIKGF